METMSAPDMAIRLRYHARQLGWQGLTGIALLLACLAFGLGVALPETGRQDQLMQDLEKLHEKIPQRKDAWIDRSPQASLHTFYEFLPEEKEALSQFGVLLYMAGANGLEPEKAVYKTDHHKYASFSRYQVSLPVRGTYVDIRTFINQALNALPNLALNEISLVRQDTASDEVEASLRFTLFVRRGNPS